MKKLLAATALVSFLQISGVSLAQANEWAGNVSGYLGNKILDDKWSELDTQISLGVIADFKRKNWPISIATDFIASGDVSGKDDDKIIGFSVENHHGIRKVISHETTSFRHYVGVGLAIINAGIEYDKDSENDKDSATGTGVWVGLGGYYDISDSVSLGADIRFSKAEGELHGEELELGGTHFGISVGHQW